MMTISEFCATCCKVLEDLDPQAFSLDVEYRWPRPDVRRESTRKHSRLELSINPDANVELANRRYRRKFGGKSKAILASQRSSRQESAPCRQI
jgi:hypothetical protein